jgi:hypothetical protein
VTAVSPAAGPVTGRTVITVTGRGFTGVKLVRVGSATATSVHVSSSGRLTAVVPAHPAGANNVQIYTTHGTSPVTSRDHFTYIAAPVVTAVGPAAGKLTKGTVVALAGRNFTSVRAVKFGSATGTSLRVQSSGHLTVVAPAHAAGAVDVRVVGAYGTSAPQVHDRFTYIGAPVITAVGPATGDPSGRARIAIAGRNFVKVTKVYFSSAAGTSPTTVSSARLTVTTPAHPAGTVDVRVATAYGTSAPVTADHFVYRDSTPPPPVTALRLVQRVALDGEDVATLAWTNPAGIDFAGVIVRRAEGTSAPTTPTQGTPIAVTGKENSFTDDPLTPGQSYAYSVFAVDAAGNAAARAALSIGSTWRVSAARLAADRGVLSAISCVGGTFCAAGDTTGNLITFGPATAGTPTPVSPGDTFDSISCPTTTFCAALDQSGAVSTYDGVHWSSPVLLSTPEFWTSISCASSQLCVAVDILGNASVLDSSGSWSEPTPIVSDGDTLGAVSCTAGPQCVVLGAEGEVITFDGTTWSAADTVLPDAADLGTVSCSSSTFCLAGSGTQYATFNGTTWSSASTLPSNGSLNSVSCSSTTNCVGLGAGGTVLAYNGTTWTAPVAATTAISADLTAVTALSCAVSGPCTVLDLSGQASTSSGSQWSAPRAIETAQGGVTSLSCAQALCLAADAHGNAFVGHGSEWSVSPVTSTPLVSVGCATATFCLGVTGGGAVFQYNGSAWTSRTAVPTHSSVTGVSCGSPSYCVAVDSDGLAYVATAISTGGAWSTAAAHTTGLTAVSCSAAATCQAVGPTGQQWSLKPGASSAVLTTHLAFTSISCASVTRCAAITADGLAAIFNGTSWSTPALVNGNAVTAVSCSSDGTCTALGEHGYSFSYGGYGWATISPFDPGDTGVVIACASSTSCTAIDQPGGNVLTGV